MSLLAVSKSIFSLLQLQLSIEEAQSRALEMEQELCSLMRERDEAQKAALLLQTTVEQLTQVRTLPMYDHKCIFSLTHQVKVGNHFRLTLKVPQL